LSTPTLDDAERVSGELIDVFLPLGPGRTLQRRTRPHPGLSGWVPPVVGGERPGWAGHGGDL